MATVKLIVLTLRACCFRNYGFKEDTLDLLWYLADIHLI